MDSIRRGVWYKNQCQTQNFISKTFVKSTAAVTRGENSKPYWTLIFWVFPSFSSCKLWIRAIFFIDFAVVDKLSPYSLLEFNLSLPFILWYCFGESFPVTLHIFLNLQKCFVRTTIHSESYIPPVSLFWKLEVLIIYYMNIYFMFFLFMRYIKVKENIADVNVNSQVHSHLIVSTSLFSYISHL